MKLISSEPAIQNFRMIIDAFKVAEVEKSWLLPTASINLELTLSFVGKPFDIDIMGDWSNF